MERSRHGSTWRCSTSRRAHDHPSSWYERPISFHTSISEHADGERRRQSVRAGGALATCQWDRIVYVQTCMRAHTGTHTHTHAHTRTHMHTHTHAHTHSSNCLGRLFLLFLVAVPKCPDYSGGVVAGCMCDVDLRDGGVEVRWNLHRKGDNGRALFFFAEAGPTLVRNLAA